MPDWREVIELEGFNEEEEKRISDELDKIFAVDFSRGQELLRDIQGKLLQDENHSYVTITKTNRGSSASEQDKEISLDLPILESIEFLSTNGTWEKMTLSRVLTHELFHVVDDVRSDSREEEAVNKTNMLQTALHGDDTPERFGYSFIRYKNDESPENQISSLNEAVFTKALSNFVYNPDLSGDENLQTLIKSSGLNFLNELTALVNALDKSKDLNPDLESSFAVEGQSLFIKISDNSKLTTYEFTSEALYRYIDYETTKLAEKGLRLAPDGFTREEIQEIREAAALASGRIEAFSISETELSFNHAMLFHGYDSVEEVSIRPGSAIVR